MRYVVKKDDNLHSIAEELYGDRFFWRLIYRQNKKLIGKDPNLIHEGQILKIKNSILLKDEYRTRNVFKKL